MTCESNQLESTLLDRVVIVGVGLMGGSLGKALIEHGVARHVIGVDNPDVLAVAIESGAIHGGSTLLCEAVTQAELVILATPIHLIPLLIGQIAPHVAPEALVTDIAGVKSRIVAEGDRLLGGRFLGGHPMAGSEQTGIACARAGLFSGAAWAITPFSPERDSEQDVEFLSGIVRAIGARPIVMSPEEHDRAAALISHLPHLLSYAYNSAVNTSPDAEMALSLAAGSYRDLTRVTASDPVLWRDAFTENRESLLAELGAFQDSLAMLESAIRSGEPYIVQNAIVSSTNSRKQV